MRDALSMGNPLRALWGAYERTLQRRPVATQVTTSALMWGTGDVIAQRLEEYERRHYGAGAAAAAAAHAKARPAAAAPPAAPEGCDWRRAGLTALYGAAFVGPVGHYWYAGLDSACARVFARGTAPFIALKVALDTAVMGPFYVATFFAYGCALIDGGGAPEFVRKMRTDFVSTLALEVSVWPFVQSVNFWKVPVKHQLLVVNSMTVMDAAFMSWARNQEDWLAMLLARMRAAPPEAKGGTKAAERKAGKGGRQLGAS